MLTICMFVGLQHFGNDGNVLYHVDIIIDNTVQPKAAVQERFRHKNIHYKYKLCHFLLSSFEF